MEFEFEFSKHAKIMLKERNIAEELVRDTLLTSMFRDIGSDGNIHYFKSVPEYGGKVLHVIVNPNMKPPRIVTVFFDRRKKK